MAKVHYFQRYSTTENTVTNNTLLLLSRIADHSPTVASQLLSELTGEAISIGIETTQQRRGKGSVPDGEILQRSFKVVIEAKVDAAVDTTQLVRHVGSFTNESQKVLLLITKQPLGASDATIRTALHQIDRSVVFKSVTYETVCEEIKNLFKEHEASINAVIEDYIEYCNDMHLFNQAPNLLRIVPCGQSAAINRRYGIYFHPSDRGYTEHSYVGIYTDKSVRAILQIENVFDIQFEDGVLTKTVITGPNTDKFDAQLRGIIPAAAEECGYDISHDNRFFCGPIADTDFKKRSSRGIQGARFKNVKEIVGSFENLTELAGKLRTMTWE
jgi:hypothetical protein